MYFTDRGIEELQERRGDEEVTLAWLADQLHVPVPTDIYTLFVFEILVLVLAIPITALWNTFK